MKKIALVLGSGGMRGIAHLGVLKVIQQKKIPITHVIGCSIGSIIGALHCCGHEPDMLLRFARQLTRRTLVDFSRHKNGLLSGNNLLEMVDLLTKHADFSQLQIPLTVAATDMNSGDQVAISEGNVAQAVRASSSVPGVFVPAALNGHSLIDGAVIDGTPIELALAMEMDAVIAVNLSHSCGQYPINDIIDVIYRTIDIMSTRNIKSFQQNDKVLLLQPEVAHISPLSFKHIDECYQAGIAEAQQQFSAAADFIEKLF